MNHSSPVGAYPASRPRNTKRIPGVSLPLGQELDALITKSWANAQAGLGGTTIGEFPPELSKPPLLTTPGYGRAAGWAPPRILEGTTEENVAVVKNGMPVKRTSRRIDAHASVTTPFFDEHAFLTAMAVWPWAHESAWMAAGLVCGCGGSVRLETAWDAGHLALGDGDTHFVVCAATGYFCAPVPGASIGVREVVPGDNTTSEGIHHCHVLNFAQVRDRATESNTAIADARDWCAERGRICVTPELVCIIASCRDAVIVDPHASSLYGARTAEQALMDGEKVVYDLSTCRVYSTEPLPYVPRLYLQTRWPMTNRIVESVHDVIPYELQEVVQLAFFWSGAASVYTETAISSPYRRALCHGVALGGYDNEACHSLLLGALQPQSLPGAADPLLSQSYDCPNVAHVIDALTDDPEYETDVAARKRLEHHASLGRHGRWQYGIDPQLARSWEKNCEKHDGAPIGNGYCETSRKERWRLHTPPGCCQPVVWMAWTDERPIPWHVALSIDSFRRNSGVEVRLVTPENVDAFVPCLPPQYKHLTPVQRAAVLRCLLLLNHGGWWADIDVMCLGPVTSRLHSLRRVSFITEPLVIGRSPSDTCDSYVGPVIANCAATQAWAVALTNKLNQKDASNCHRTDFDLSEITRRFLSPVLGRAAEDMAEESRTFALSPECTWSRLTAGDDVVAAVREGVTVIKTNNGHYGHVLREVDPFTVIGSRSEYGEVLRACFGNVPAAWLNQGSSLSIQSFSNRYSPPAALQSLSVPPGYVADDHLDEQECRRLVASSLQRWYGWMGERTALGLLAQASAPLRHARRIWFTDELGAPILVLRMRPLPGLLEHDYQKYDLTISGWGPETSLHRPSHARMYDYPVELEPPGYATWLRLP